MNKKDKGLFVAARLLSHFVYDGLSRAAAELAFYLLFSLFPLIMVFHSLLSLIEIGEETLLSVTAMLPAAVQEIVLGYLAYLQEMPVLQPLLIGTALTLYFVSRAVRSMMHTIGDLYGVSARKQGLRRILTSLLLTVFSLLMLASSLVLIVFSRRVLSMLRAWFPQIAPYLPVWSSIGVLAAAAALLVFLLLCYRLLPGVPVRWREALPGAVTSLAAWVLLTRGFAFYVDHMARYSLLYGSIGAIIVLMLWLELSALTLLLGAAFNHVLMIEVKEEESRLQQRRMKNKEDKR